MTRIHAATHRHWHFPAVQKQSVLEKSGWAIEPGETIPNVEVLDDGRKAIVDIRSHPGLLNRSDNGKPCIKKNFRMPPENGPYAAAKKRFPAP